MKIKVVSYYCGATKYPIKPNLTRPKVIYLFQNRNFEKNRLIIFISNNYSCAYCFAKFYISEHCICKIIIRMKNFGGISSRFGWLPRSDYGIVPSYASAHTNIKIHNNFPHSSMQTITLPPLLVK